MMPSWEFMIPIFVYSSLHWKVLHLTWHFQAPDLYEILSMHLSLLCWLGRCCTAERWLTTSNHWQSCRRAVIKRHSGSYDGDQNVRVWNKCARSVAANWKQFLCFFSFLWQFSHFWVHPVTVEFTSLLMFLGHFISCCLRRKKRLKLHAWVSSPNQQLSKSFFMVN